MANFLIALELTQGLEGWYTDPNHRDLLFDSWNVRPSVQQHLPHKTSSNLNQLRLQLMMEYHP